MAGRIKEEFYRPTIIISEGEKISKSSARSVSGFNIVEAIRKCGEHLIDARLKPSTINWYLLENLRRLEPYGIGNPRPVFLTDGLQVVSIKAVGSNNKHLRLGLRAINRRPPASRNLSGIGFDLGYLVDKDIPR